MLVAIGEKLLPARILLAPWRDDLDIGIQSVGGEFESNCRPFPVGQMASAPSLRISTIALKMTGRAREASTDNSFRSAHSPG